LELCLGLVFWCGVIRKSDSGLFSLMQYSFEGVLNGMLMDDFGMLGFPHAFSGYIYAILSAFIGILAFAYLNSESC
jgi:hypothetical protein